MVPLLTMFGDIEIHTAIGASIVSVIACSCGGAAPFLKNRLTNIRLAIALEMGICRNEGDCGFDIVTIDAEDPTATVPTPSFPGSRDRIVRSMVLAVLPHVTGPGGIDGGARTGRGSFHDWPLGAPLRS